MSSAVTASPAPTRTARARYIGVDLARFLAVAGMMAAHLVAVNASNPTASAFEQQAAEIAKNVTSGTAAALFAVLGGLSAVFASRRALAEGRTGAAIGSVAIRGVLLMIIGFALGYFEGNIVVVLAYYGVAMLIAAPFVAARGWVLGVVAAVLGLVVGPLNVLARQALGVVSEAGSPSFASLVEQPIETLRGLLLTGTYPAATWVVYLLVGMLIGRALITATAKGKLVRVSFVLAAAGTAIAIAASSVSAWVVANLSLFGVSAPEGFDSAMFTQFVAGEQFGAPFSSEPWAQLIAAPHSGSAADLLRTIGIAAAVIGLLVALFDRTGRAPGPVLNVFRSAGAAPLTIYTLHIIASSMLAAPLLAQTEITSLPWWYAGLGIWALQLGGALLVGAALAAIHRRGPLEALLSGTAKVLTRS